MNRRLGMLTAPAALVLAAALSLSACGDKENKADTDTKSGSSSSTEASGEALTKDTFMSTITAAQVKAKTSHVSMDLGVSGQSIKAEGDVRIGASAADTAMAMTMDLPTGDSGKLEMRLFDQVFYLNFGQMTQNKFAKIDLADKNSPLGKQYGQLLGQMDPSKQMEQLSKALVSFDKKGSPQKLDGVDAQPYEVVVDTAKIPGMAAVPGASSSVPKTLTYTIFVGSDDLPRRIVTEVAGSKVSVDYSKWGEAVNIKAPAAGEISDQDLGKLLGGATTS